VTVYLVGAGPGDPGLVTVRGAELLSRADVVVYDRLSARSLLDLAPTHALRIDVGKRAGDSHTQDDINSRLVELGRTHQCVVRLKGGDPFVFARGGEEAAALGAAGVAYEVVPGITSAIGALAYAGIPVTSRYSSASFTVVTGHEDLTKEDPQVDWRAVARLGGTIVILMGVARWETIRAELLSGGLAPETPAAAVRWGTRPDQFTVRGTLADLDVSQLGPPATIVIGDVARLDLDWFQRRPLSGLSVVVTRARDQAGQLVGPLRELGATVVEYPVIEVVDPADGGAALDSAVERLSTFDWVVLTSVNGADRFLDAVADGRRLGGVRLAAVGPGTADAIGRRFLRVDLVPPKFVADSLLEVMPEPPAGGGTVLLARAAVARDVLPDGLAARGWQVEVVDAYRTVAAVPSPGLRHAVAEADVVTFTSASTVDRFVASVGIDRMPDHVVSIGPVTSAAAQALGVTVSVEATDHTIDGLIDAMVRNGDRLRT